MFEELLEACKRLEEIKTPSWEISEDILKLIPDKTIVQALNEFLSNVIDKSDHVPMLLVAYATLIKIGKNSKKQDGKDGNDEDDLNDMLHGIADHLSSIILPICSGASLDEDTTDYTQLRRKGEVGLLAIEQLINTPLKAPLQLRPSVLLRLTAFTDVADPWATAESSALARKLLEAQLQILDESQTKSLIVEEILTTFLRPLFSKSRSTAVTASGRKAEFVEQSRYDTVDRETPETKPWKYTHRYAITVFSWAVEHSDSTLLQTHWPSFTPALLTLLDEPSHAGLKVRGLQIFRSFWSRCPPNLMHTTGLASVFEDAVFPAVLLLPTLTPEDESIEILNAAYPALIEMSGLKYPNPGSDPGPGLSTNGKQQITETQRRLLDKIIREGVMVGYHHAKEHVRLVGLFCDVLVCIINGMGILAVKHLKDFIPMVSEIMTDPFGTKHPPTLASATQLLQTILRNCWPRIPHYCNEVVKILMLCWLNIEDEDSFSSTSPIANDLKVELTKTADILSAVMKASKVDFHERVGVLIEKEPQLSKLFRDINPE
ncbi:uncharacterized protein GGS22DRAFT_182924 [Annulohypoxylon maeteangense]|uniref:uncharacterized protein n=1 Tax=Annulohypoxylon maeteangense TaxID=1927788 RepID=UPI0020082210|nr:uncharacterized protein GGS22DRAFT_182924 [Annulohypoxylon maeteangense]KAI0889580.1 hypothetical protein GGS22DRAFT_182924 [Annulohypoxylon maeteangense]